MPTYEWATNVVEMPCRSLGSLMYLNMGPICWIVFMFKYYTLMRKSFYYLSGWQNVCHQKWMSIVMNVFVLYCRLIGFFYNTWYIVENINLAMLVQTRIKLCCWKLYLGQFLATHVELSIYGWICQIIIFTILLNLNA